MPAVQEPIIETVHQTDHAGEVADVPSRPSPHVSASLHSLRSEGWMPGAKAMRKA